MQVKPPALSTARFGNPTTAELEQKLAALEGADEALVVASGMAAVSAIMYALADSGDEVAYIGPLYGGTGCLPQADLQPRRHKSHRLRERSGICWPTSAPPPRWYCSKP